MYVLYNIQGNVLLIKLMRKLYQILYNVGRLTDAPARRTFPFRGNTWAVGRFARGKGARSYEARFSPSRSPFPGTSLFCVVVCYNVLKRILYSSVLVVWGLCRWVCGERKAVCAADLFLHVLSQKTKLLLFAISQGTGPLRGPLSRPAEQKNRLSLTPPIQQHTGLSR